MSFFKELKHSNVFRVGVAYDVAVWVFIQVLFIFLSTLKNHIAQIEAETHS